MKARPSNRHIPLRIPPTSAVILGVVALSACSTTPSNFKTEGEKFLQSPELAQEAGYTFGRAQCEQPASTTVGTQFTCTATDNDGDDWEFVVEITGERELTVVSGDLIN
jgi:hypothetical protein